MLATQLNHLVDEERLKKLDVVEVKRLVCYTVQSKKLVILLSLSAVKHCIQRLGDPQNVVPPAKSNTNASSPPGLGRIATLTGPAVLPIKRLSLYSSKWTIKARVAQKSAIEEFSTARAQGKLFFVTLMDESGEIRATGFNQCVTEFYDRLQEGKVYYISKARVNSAKKKFSSLNNDYELGLERNTVIIECTHPNEVIAVKFNFVELAALEHVQKDSLCDVIAVVKYASQCQEVSSKARKPLTKRELNLVDHSGMSIQLTLWGQQALDFDEPLRTVVAFKGVKVGDFGGLSLSMVGSSIMTSNPNIPEAHVLCGWFDAGGSKTNFKSFSRAGISSGQGSYEREELFGSRKINFREECHTLIDLLKSLY